ncbi:MAG: PD-(D/E)XK nuclease-like domain-containing protein [Tannerellaceae bacterium]|jgi:hypothetical protein|nr:PD-(D/E)XK nuclease-like domain-containing protein [Tannerellaceae bacterium]
MDYYKLPEVSNSDLSWLKNQLYPKETVSDPTEAYAFGSLIDAMLTEPDRVDYFKRTLDGKRIKKELFENAVKMKQAFRRDDFCSDLTTHSDGQKISIVHDKEYSYKGFPFVLNVRCKWDIWREDWGWGGDIKSTTAKTQKEFEAASLYFDYDRQRAFYMDLQGSKRDVLIGISKVNHRIFKIFINRESEFYKQGRDKYLALAFKWYLLFGKDKDPGTPKG